MANVIIVAFYVLPENVNRRNVAFACGLMTDVICRFAAIPACPDSENALRRRKFSRGG